MENIADIKTEMAVGTRWRVADVQGKTERIIEIVGFSETRFFFVCPDFEGYTEDELYLGFMPPCIEGWPWPKCDRIRDVAIDDAKTFTMSLYGRPISRYTKLDYKSDKKFINACRTGSLFLNNHTFPALTGIKIQIKKPWLYALFVYSLFL